MVTEVEQRMLDTLRRGCDEHGIVAVKAEFEAEGTRREELLRLHDLARRAGLDLVLKIGGCEAVSDLRDASLFGAEYAVAPMVETPYALSKFVAAKALSHGPTGEGCRFLFNLETPTAFRNLSAMLDQSGSDLHGIVFGRVDFTLSSGLRRGDVNSLQVTQAVLAAASACADRGIELWVGGSVSIESLNVLREIRQVQLDRFETRKIVFDGSILDRAGAEQAIEAAVAFERDWLQSKRDYYQRIADEDLSRLEMLEARSRPRPAQSGETEEAGIR